MKSINYIFMETGVLLRVGRIFVFLIIVFFISCESAVDSLSAGDTKTSSKPEHPGKRVYEDYCFSCHTPGLSGAPKIGDSGVWEVRLEQGKEALLLSTIDGIQPAMPPRGLCFECTDEQLELAIDYIIAESQ